MTVNEAIVQADTLKPNMFTLKEKVRWLNQLDALIFQDVVKTHVREPDQAEEFVPYDPDGLLDETLIAPHPYDALYRHWLHSQIDLNNAEMSKYNVSSALYNQAYSEFVAWYNRTHMPVSRIRAIKL